MNQSNECWYVVHLPDGDFKVASGISKRMLTTATGPFISDDNAYEWAERLKKKRAIRVFREYCYVVVMLLLATTIAYLLS